MTVVVPSTNLLLATTLVVGTRRAAARAGLSAPAGRRLAAAVAAVLVAWFTLAVAVVRAPFSPLDLPVLALIGGPVVVGVAAPASPTWRRVVRSTPPAWLVGVQAYRVVGVVFLAVWAAGGLPPYFALPAGIGDLLTGAGAVVVAALLVRGSPRGRPAAVGGNAFGVADLVVAVARGVRCWPGGSRRSSRPRRRPRSSSPSRSARSRRSWWRSASRSTPTRSWDSPRGRPEPTGRSRPRPARRGREGVG